MPTAAVAKLEKQGSLDANDPLRLGIVMVEHKIRNLEKRKAKLDGYRDLQKSGKDLNTDQLEAISKYDAVLQQLEFAKELSKHLTNLALDAVKNIKKQARKEALEKAQQDLARTKEMLMLQDVLSSMGQENVRDDLLQGKAKVTISSEELQQIDDLFIELAPKREKHILFQDMFQGPAETMCHLLEGKNKEICGTTYTALKAKLVEVAKSGYFDNPQPEPEPVVEETPIPPVEEPSANVNVNVAPIEQGPVLTCTFQPSHVNQIPAAVVAPQVTPQPAIPVPVPVVMPPIAQPEEIRGANAIETTYFTPSHLRVFQSGTIDFMQDNELDTPDHVEAPPSIPTMTYTNQSFTPMEAAQQPAPVVATPPQPEPQQIYQNQTDEEKGWSHVGGDNHHHQPAQPQPQPHTEENNEWTETEGTGEDSWANQTEQQWSQPAQTQANDGFITQGGRGRGGRGRGGGGSGGERNQKGGFSNNRGGSRPSRGGYNNRDGGYNREGGYSSGGNYKDQNSYQNGYQNRSERGGRGRGGGGQSADRQGGRGRGGGGSRPGGGFRGGFRQQQQQQQ